MHTRTWLVWLLAALVATGLTNNPLYMVLILLVATLVFFACHDDTPLARAYRLFFLTGFALWISYVVFSVITVGGARGRTFLLMLPSLTLPPFLGGITLGGPLTMEDLIWGAIRGLRIWTLMTIFGTFNALIDYYRLLRLTPRSLFHVGLAVTIAVTFVPHTLHAIIEIIESQRVRGHRLRGLRTSGPLISSLLASSLEKSIQLAEAMDARGYGRTRTTDSALGRQQIGVFVGMVFIGMGLFGWLYYAGTTTDGQLYTIVTLILLLTGFAVLLLALHALGQRVPRTIYRRERWHQRDTVVVVLALGSVVGLILSSFSRDGLLYNPYPIVTLPPFDLLNGSLFIILAAPAIFGTARKEENPRRISRLQRQPEEQSPSAIEHH